MKNSSKAFTFEKTDNGYILKDYLLRNDGPVNHVEIPSKYKGHPIKEIGGGAFILLGHLTEITIPDEVERIGIGAFSFCGLKSVTLPKSLKEIGTEAFGECSELEQIIFQGDNVKFGYGSFEHCPKLAAENIMQSLTRSCDITKPFVPEESYSEEPGVDFDWKSALREDVFELAIKYDSFALFNKARVLEEIVKRNLGSYLPLTENAEWSITDEDIERLLNISSDKGFVEITAWLLDYKNRKIGFSKNKSEF